MSRVEIWQSRGRHLQVVICICVSWFEGSSARLHLQARNALRFGISRFQLVVERDLLCASSMQCECSACVLREGCVLHTGSQTGQEMGTAGQSNPVVKGAWHRGRHMRHFPAVRVFGMSSGKRESSLQSNARRCCDVWGGALLSCISDSDVTWVCVFHEVCLGGALLSCISRGWFCERSVVEIWHGCRYLMHPVDTRDPVAPLQSRFLARSR